jgi:hypothetical protein
MDKTRTTRLLCFFSLGVLAFGFIAALPGFLIPLGLPPEGDAVDYRISFMKWILRHGSYPNWSWTPIDDYPSLGELFMLPLYAFSPGLARLIPLLAHFACAYFAARIFMLWQQERRAPSVDYRLGLIVAAAWILPLRPLAIQSNLFMTDNLASAFCLGALCFALEGKAAKSGIAFAGALASKYMIWGAAPGIFLCLASVLGFQRSSIRPLVLFVVLSMLGALPFMVRNYFVNGGNPFFPMFLGFFGQEAFGLNYNLGQYGRGRDIVALLLFPYDFLITHNFIRDLYDYTLGKLFFVQCAFFLAAVSLNPKAAFAIAKDLFRSRLIRAAALFFIIHFLAWFSLSQQMRFFVPGVILLNLLLLHFCWNLLPRLALTLVVGLGFMSILSIQKDSIQMAFAGKENIFQKEVDRAQACYARLGGLEGKVVGHGFRDGTLGFFDHEFIFVRPHVYRVDYPGKPAPEPDFIYAPLGGDYPGYISWPEAEPCILIKQ